MPHQSHCRASTFRGDPSTSIGAIAMSRTAGQRSARSLDFRSAKRLGPLGRSLERGCNVRSTTQREHRVDFAHSRVSRFGFYAASTGPRHGGRGIRAGQLPRIPRQLASTGPRHGGRGWAFPFLDGDELARVAREGDALKQRAGNLAGEFARGPSLRGGLLEVEAAALRAALSGSRR